MRSNGARRRLLPLLLPIIVLMAAGLGWLATRAGVSATSRLNARITIECAAATGASPAACGEWGDAILAHDPAPPTFERGDLRRVTIDRSMFGVGSDCAVAFFIARYPDSPVWSGGVPCR
jgi:hypothetical protein